MNKIDNFQLKQLEKLRSGEKFAYEDASVYTVLLDLIENTDLNEVVMILHNVASDLGKKEELEDIFDKLKWLTWE